MTVGTFLDAGATRRRASTCRGVYDGQGDDLDGGSRHGGGWIVGGGRVVGMELGILMFYVVQLCGVF